MILFFSINALLLITLAFLAFQDIKYRAISWWLIPVILLLLGFRLLEQNVFIEDIVFNMSINLLLIMIQLLLVTIYFSLKERRFVNIIDKYLGLGDILFFLSCSVAFKYDMYIMFLLFSFLTAIVVAFFYMKLFKKKTILIPLAGIMSINLILLISIDFLFSINLFLNQTTL